MELGSLFNTNILQYFTDMIWHLIMKQVRKMCSGMCMKLKKCLFTWEYEGWRLIAGREPLFHSKHNKSSLSLWKVQITRGWKKSLPTCLPLQTAKRRGCVLMWGNTGPNNISFELVYHHHRAPRCCMRLYFVAIVWLSVPRWLIENWWIIYVIEVSR